MVTIRELLTRIQWDKDFGAAEFELGCYDRVSGRIERISLAQVRLEPGRHFAFTVQDGLSAGQTIPFHRVREVYRNGEKIWARPDPATDE